MDESSEEDKEKDQTPETQQKQQEIREKEKKLLDVAGKYDFYVSFRPSSIKLISIQDIVQILKKQPLARIKKDLLMLESEFGKLDFFKSLISNETVDTLKQCLKAMKV